jgi:hypothetical protein
MESKEAAERRKKRRIAYYWKNRAVIRIKQNKYSNNALQEHRHSILEVLGLKCVRCGFIDIRALQIDHVNGGGRKENRATSGLGYYKKILSRILAGSKEFQILCANCNWIKKFENKENPYKKII